MAKRKPDPKPAPTIEAATIRAVCDERLRQNRQWGGPDHDDRHEPDDWLKFIEHQVTKAKAEVGKSATDGGDGDPSFEVRDRLVKIAALACAGIDSIDRKEDER